MKRTKHYLIALIGLVLIIFAIYIDTKTVSYASTRIASESTAEQEVEENTDDSLTTEEYALDETLLETTTTKLTTSDEDDSNYYSARELIILITSTSLAIIILLTEILTVFGHKSLSGQFQSPKKLIYYYLSLVLLVPVVSISVVYLSDKNILNKEEILNEVSVTQIQLTVPKSENNITYSSTNDNETILTITNGTTYTGENITFNKSGDLTGSNQLINMAISLDASSKLELQDSTITTNGIKALAIYTTDNKTSATLTNLTITTYNIDSPALYADNNSTIKITDSKLNSQESNSPLLYSKGTIEVTNTELTTLNNFLGLIEGAHSITITDSNLTNTSSYGSFYLFNNYDSSSTTEDEATLTIKNSTLNNNETDSQAPLFYLDNTNAVINLSNSLINYNNKIFLDLDEYSKASITLADMDIIGDINVSNGSTLRMNINTSSYTGTINGNNTSIDVDITLDSDSTWTLTGDSYVNILSITKSDATRKNIRKYIKSNGYNIYYNAENNEWLNGQTISLPGGGKLIPYTN